MKIEDCLQIDKFKFSKIKYIKTLYLLNELILLLYLSTEKYQWNIIYDEKGGRLLKRSLV